MSDQRIKSFGGVVYDVIPVTDEMAENGVCVHCHFCDSPDCKGMTAMDCAGVVYQLSDPHLHQQQTDPLSPDGDSNPPVRHTIEPLPSYDGKGMAEDDDPTESLRDRIAMRVLPELIRNGNPSTIVETVADALAYADEFLRQRKESK